MEFLPIYQKMAGEKRVNRRYLSCLKPDLAHFLGAASSDKNPGLLFYEKSGFLIEKNGVFVVFPVLWGFGKSLKGYLRGKTGP